MFFLQKAKFVLFFFLFLWGLLACTIQLKDDPQKNTAAEQSNSPQVNQQKAAEINVELAIGYLQQGDISRAKQKLLLAEKQAPRSPYLWDAYGYFYSMTDNDQQARAAYQKALTLSPGNGKILNNYGVYLCRKKDYRGSIQYFKRAIADPHYLTVAEAYENAGFCAMKIPDTAQARQYFQKAVDNNPELPSANLALAQFAYKDKHYGEALFYLKRYKLHAAPSVDSLQLEMKLAELSHDQDTVASDLLQLNQKFPNKKWS